MPVFRFNQRAPEDARLRLEPDNMDSHEFNKIAGGVLGMLLFAFALNVAAKGLVGGGKPGKPGYDLPAAAEGGEAAAKGEKAEPLPVLLAKADVKKGEGDVKVCTACHNFEKGAAVKAAPPLYGVVGRPVGAIEAWTYSDSLKAKGGNWTLEALNAFIANPKAYASGTKMAYPGMADAAKRAEVLAYLNSLADSPLPLPK